MGNANRVNKIQRTSSPSEDDIIKILSTTCSVSYSEGIKIKRYMDDIMNSAFNTPIK